jgi:hypothetical protein
MHKRKRTRGGFWVGVMVGIFLFSEHLDERSTEFGATVVKIWRNEF